MVEAGRDSGVVQDDFTQIQRATGIRRTGGYHFTVTQLLDYVGVAEGDDAVIRFEPSDKITSGLTGHVLTGDVDGGRSDPHNRKIQWGGETATIYLSDQTIRQLGVSFDPEKNPPTIELWASGDAIMVKAPATSYILDVLDIFPERVRSDYREVVLGETDIETWAQSPSREPKRVGNGSDAKWEVKLNIRRVEKKLSEWGVNTTRQTGDVGGLYINYEFVGLVKAKRNGPKNKNQYRVSVTPAIRFSVDVNTTSVDDLTGEFYPEPYEDGIIDAVPVFFSEQDPPSKTLSGQYTRKVVNPKTASDGLSLRMTIPPEVISMLGVDKLQQYDQKIALFAGERSLLIGFPKTQPFVCPSKI